MAEPAAPAYEGDREGPMPHREITFRPLQAADLSRMADWLNRPHLRAFFQREPTTAAEVAAKYGPRIRGEAPTHCSFALLDGAPFGFLQCYRVADRPDWQAVIEADHGVCIDLFIGEPELLGKGFGQRMLRDYVQTVAFPLYPDETVCWIAHELENRTARACSLASGFTPVREFVEDGRRSVLMRRELKRDVPGTLVVYAELEVSAEHRAWIEAVRRKHDPQVDLAPAHVILVFPFDGVDADVVADHVRAVARQTPALPFMLDRAAAVRDGFAPRSHVFLLAGQGDAALRVLHDQLYAGPLAPLLRADIPFHPHVTVAAFADHGDAERLAASLGPVTLAGEIEALTLGGLADGVLSVRECFRLLG